MRGSRTDALGPEEMATNGRARVGTSRLDCSACADFYILNSDLPQAPSLACLYVRLCARDAAWHVDSGKIQSLTSHFEHAVHEAASSSSAYALQSESPQRDIFADALRSLLADGFFSAQPAAISCS
jgi:hypothetical protein